MYESVVRHTKSPGTKSPGTTKSPAAGLPEPDDPPGQDGPAHVDEAAGPGDSGGGAVVARGLGKRFGDAWALRGLDLDVPAGTVLGLLGHNGAGKTTAIRILTTLSRPSEGTARVAGADVATAAPTVRARIGVAAQQATVDGLLGARANLVMVGRLYGLSRRAAGDRADELLERFDLSDATARLVKDYSGGMRRRLDLAAALVASPPVLFLDEPTTGLDPRSRGQLWDMLRGLVDGGTTIVLTTQYLEEADRMADDIVVLDHGRVAAHGTPAGLKSRVGGDRLGVTVASATDAPRVVEATARFATTEPAIDADGLRVTVPIGADVRLMDVLRALDRAAVEALDIDRRGATLDDVFLALTSPLPTTSRAVTTPVTEAPA